MTRYEGPAWGPRVAEQCRACVCYPRSLWGPLESEDLALLNGSMRSHSYAAGQSLFLQGEPANGLYCLRAGTVALRTLDEFGNSVLLGLAYAGEVIGHRAMVSGEEHKTSAESLGPSLACKISRQTVMRLIEARPGLAIAMLRLCSREIGRMQDSLVRASVLNNRGRLLQVMMEMFARHGTREADGAHSIELPISRRDLASLIGARQETLSRVIGRIEAEELACFSGRRVVIPNLPAFIEAANSCQP